MGDNDSQDLGPMRHSLAHIMATAVMKLWPDAKLGVGPAIDNGFYYDIDLGDKQISDENFKAIETEMKRVIKADQTFEQSDKSVDEAIKWAQDNNQDYKVELLNDLKRSGTTVAKDLDAKELGTIAQGDSEVDSASFYTNGEFTDLCRGPHVESTGKVGAFKLYKVAGAYWRGDESKPMMQRLYGVAFATQEELDKYFEMMEEAKKRDHRKLGKQLGLFSFSNLVGSGLPLFSPTGTRLKNALESYSLQLRKGIGFEEVSIPHIAKQDLYETSGHWSKFGDELFLVKSQETNDQLVLKPMNCPHHIEIYAAQPRSYRDLPIKYMENTTMYRDEKSGELHGLSRVRSIGIDDNHAFVREDQIKETIDGLVSAAQKLYGQLDMQLKFRLSFRDDSEGYLGDAELWNKAQSTLKEVVENEKLDFFIEEGEAAFYGPKIDFLAIDSLKREWQLATVQLDFVLPERFGLEYTSKDGHQQQPVMIHCALLGSFERFLSVYIEHTNGHFPFWLAPEQVRILTINDGVLDYVEKVTDVLADVVLMKPLKYNEVRHSVDKRNESLGKKIRDAQSERIPVMLIIGPKDKKANEVSVRTQDGESKVALDKLAEFLQNYK